MPVPGKSRIEDKSVADDVRARLDVVLPDGWRLTDASPAHGAPAWGIASPDGASATLGLSVVRSPGSPGSGGESPVPTSVTIGRFLGPAARRQLDALGRNYADATGNTRICLARPGLVIRTDGASRDPGPRLLPERTLQGPAAASFVRTLCDSPLPVTLGDAGRRAGIDLGYASRLLTWMVQADLITRASRGPVTRVDVPALLARWATAYRVFDTHRPLAMRDPAGHAGNAVRMKAVTSRYAITGTYAANRLAVFAPRRPMLLYAERPTDVIDALGLVGTDADPDIILLEPAAAYVFDRAWITGGLVFASPSQVAIDLLTGTPEGQAFADDVITWMVRRRQ